MKALANEDAAATTETKITEPVIDDKVFQEVISPLNTSIQATKQEMRTSLGQINSKLEALTAGQRPESTEEIDPATAEVRNMRTEMAQLRLNNAYARATGTLNAFKAKH